MECTHDNYRHSHGAAADTKRQQPPRKETTIQYKDWDGNLLPDPAPRIHNVHIGDVIKIKENEENPGRWGKPFREYEIIEIYPRIVLTRDKKTGFRRSFSYGDLLTMGLENQDSEIETMRRSYAKDQRKESISMTRSSFNPDYDPEKYRKKRKKKNEDSGEENPAEVLPDSEE